VSVLCALEHRLNLDESSLKLEGQLPSLLAELLGRCRRQAQLRPRDIGRREFLQLVSDYLGGSSIDPEQTVRRVFEAVAEQVTPGETQKIIHRLPRALRELWPERARAAEERVVPSVPRRPRAHLERAPDLVEDILAQTLPAQLGILKTVVPRILARLGSEDRRGFTRALETEIALRMDCLPPYDLRPGRDPRHARQP